MKTIVLLDAAGGLLISGSCHLAIYGPDPLKDPKNGPPDMKPVRVYPERPA